jgi:hypothetical protein
MANDKFYDDGPERIFTVGVTDLDMDADPYTTIVNLEHALDIAEKYITELEVKLDT